MSKYQVIIVGSGFGGQLAAINLRKIGITDFLILERRSFMGGTWVQNTYPGAAVDVPSPLYSLSCTPFDWSQMYADQKELEAYTKHTIAKYKLKEVIKLNQCVSSVEWKEEERLWHIFVDGEDCYQAQFVINASGPLSEPVIPEFKGVENFKGAAFHSNMWDHSEDYKGKKVAVIGSGASAVQIIPELADEVEQLHVFQRTPHWVIPRPDKKFSRLQRKLLSNKTLGKLMRGFLYWSMETRIIAIKYSRFFLKILAERSARKHLKRQVTDENLRAQLTPEFTIGCKRVLLSNTFYPALVNQNVTLHTEEDGISEITAEGVLTGSGTEVPLDMIVFATGFDAAKGAVSYPVFGRNKFSLNAFWKDYPRAYLGTALPQFPNFFVVTGPNTGIGHTSALFMIEAQFHYIMQSIAAVLTKQKQTIEVTEKAEERYTKMIHDEMEKTVWRTGGCQSWYQSENGKVTAMFPGFSFSFRKLTKNFREEDHQFS